MGRWEILADGALRRRRIPQSGPLCDALFVAGNWRFQNYFTY